MENQKQQKYRVISVLTKDEKEALKVLAWDSQRSIPCARNISKADGETFYETYMHNHSSNSTIHF
jgi:hypothetical protein